jgi:hypothetical protein
MPSFERNRPPMGPAGNMSDWVNALENLGVEPGELVEGRKAGLKGLEELHLPHNPTITVSPADFFRNTEGILKEVGTPKIYIALVPKDPQYPRYSYGGLYTNRAASYVGEKIPRNLRQFYNIAIQPFYENVYGGNIVTQPDGGVFVEFTKGKQVHVARGKVTPEYTITRDQFTNSLKFSFEDPVLRDLMYTTLLAIPHSGSGRELTFTPGYYEFALVQKTDNGPLEPIFLEYRDSAIYQLPAPAPLQPEGPIHGEESPS